MLGRALFLPKRKDMVRRGVVVVSKGESARVRGLTAQRWEPGAVTRWNSEYGTGRDPAAHEWNVCGSAVQLRRRRKEGHGPAVEENLADVGIISRRL